LQDKIKDTVLHTNVSLDLVLIFHTFFIKATFHIISDQAPPISQKKKSYKRGITF